MATLEINQKQGGPKFEKDSLFEVRIRGSVVASDLLPYQVLDIVELLMKVQVGLPVPKDHRYAEIFLKMIRFNIIP